MTWCIACVKSQVFVYNEHVIENGILPSLVDMFLEVANKTGDQVGG